MQIYTFSEPGEGHRNEDAIATRAHPADPSATLIALSDGQGGQLGGARAARIAADAALEAASRFPIADLLTPTSWVDICHSADVAVAADREAGYTTLVALCATAEWVVGGSSGDSAAVLLLDDVSLVLTERQRKNPPIGSGGGGGRTVPAGVSVPRPGGGGGGV